MASIKVTYQSTVRRFTVPNNITWLDLESKLRELFSLSPTLKFTLSYTDDEGDVVTLSTDLELQELFSSSKPSLKFVLTPEKQQPFVVKTFSDNTSENDFVSIEKEKLIPNNVSENVDKHIDVIDAADEPSFKPTIPSISKGKQKEELPAESSTFAANDQQQEEKQPSPDNNEQRAPFIDLAEQFQGLIDQFKDVISKNPQLIEQVNNIMDQILRNVPVDINQWAQWLSTLQPEGDTQTTNDQGNNSQREQQQQQQHGQFPSFFPPPHSLLSSPWIQRIIQDINANYPAGGFGNFENFARHTGFNGPWNFNGSCPYRQQQQQQQHHQEELSQEALKEKINILHSMGFWEDDVKNEELLKRYNGNIDRVVEILIRHQAERINNNSMENVVDGQ